jgi:hypothetical protein
MSFFEGLVQAFVIGKLGFDTIVFSQDRLSGFRPLPEIRTGGLFKQFACARS